MRARRVFVCVCVCVCTPLCALHFQLRTRWHNSPKRADLASADHQKLTVNNIALARRQKFAPTFCQRKLLLQFPHLHTSRQEDRTCAHTRRMHNQDGFRCCTQNSLPPFRVHHWSAVAEHGASVSLLWTIAFAHNTRLPTVLIQFKPEDGFERQF